MLTRLYVSNYALIHELEIEFRPGVTIITGETGAGKSILLGALSLILGERADSHAVRNPESKVVVEASFDIAAYALQPYFEENGIDDWGNECVVRREISATGRSRSFVNDSPVSLSILKDLASRLVDIHSQHSNMLLSKPAFQLSILDSIARNKEVASQYHHEYICYNQLQKQLLDTKSKLEKSKAATPYVANLLEKIDKLDVEKSIPLTYTTIIPSIYTNELPSIDTKAKTLYIPADTMLIDKRLNGTVSLEKQTFSFTASSSAVCIFYDIKNSTLYSTVYSQCAALNPNNYLLLFAIRTDIYNHGYGKVSSTCPVIVDGRLYGVIDIESANSNSNDNNPYIHSINHRGYNTVAPENTLSAFKLSKKKGFDYVETDISFTSDNIPVLLHDSTIDRTSNGSGNISEMTFEQVRTYDFGSWKNSVYAGEKIPSFEEFCKLCKQIGLKPYVELKTAPTNEQLTTLVNNAKRYGILNDITWISFVSSALEKVLTSLPKARVGIITSGLTQTTIDWVKSKKTDANDVFIDENISSLSSDNVQLCIADNIPLEVWTVNTSAAIQNADSYITGFTSDILIANKQLFDAIV